MSSTKLPNDFTTAKAILDGKPAGKFAGKRKVCEEEEEEDEMIPPPLEMTQRSEGDDTTQEMAVEATSDENDNQEEEEKGEQEEEEEQPKEQPGRKKNKDLAAVTDYFEAFPQGPRAPYGLPPFMSAEDLFKAKRLFSAKCPSYTPLSKESMLLHVKYVPESMHMIFIGYDDVYPGVKHVRISRGAIERRDWPTITTPVIKISSMTAAGISALGSFEYIREMRAANSTYTPSEYAPSSYAESHAEFAISTEYNPSDDAKKHLEEIPYKDFFGVNPKNHLSAWARKEVADFFWETRNAELRALRRICNDRSNFPDAVFEDENNKTDFGFWVKKYRKAMDKKANSKELDQIVMETWRGSSSSIYATHPPQLDAAGKQMKEAPCQTRLNVCASTSLFAKFKPNKKSRAYQATVDKSEKPVSAGTALAVALHYPDIAEEGGFAPIPQELIRVMDANVSDENAKQSEDKVTTYVGTVVSAVRKFQKPDADGVNRFAFALDTVPLHLRKFNPGTEAAAQLTLRLNLSNGSGSSKKKKICTFTPVLRQVYVFEAASPNKSSLATAGDVDEIE